MSLARLTARAATGKAHSFESALCLRLDLYRLAAKLPAKHRAVAFLLLAGDSIEDIAEKLDMHPRTLRRYRRVIRLAFAELKD